MDEMPLFQIEEVVQEIGMARTVRTHGPIILIVCYRPKGKALYNHKCILDFGQRDCKTSGEQQD